MIGDENILIIVNKLSKENTSERGPKRDKFIKCAIIKIHIVIKSITFFLFGIIKCIISNDIITEIGFHKNGLNKIGFIVFG